MFRTIVEFTFERTLMAENQYYILQSKSNTKKSLSNVFTQ